MKVYLKDQNLYWLDEELEGAEMSWVISPLQEEFLRNGGCADLVDTQLIIIPKAAETVIEKSAILTKREFLGKITPEEFVAIKNGASTNPYVDYFWQMFTLSEFIDINHPDTIQGVNMLEQFGLLSSGRALEILN